MVRKVHDWGVIDHPLDTVLGYQLRRASAAVLADLAHSLDEVALKPTEASVLLVIAHNPGITQSEVGRILAIKRANMAPIAALLSERDLVDRTRADGRSQGLELTDAGRELARDVRARIDAQEARFLPHLSPRRRALLVDLLRHVWAG